MFNDVNDVDGADGWVDWAHGGRHIEFWVRASDLSTRRFDRVWALIRTDF